MIAKIVAIRMIELGYSNREIAEVVELSAHTIRNYRTDYNRAAKVPIVSKAKKPRFGTVSREVWELINENPNMREVDICKLTGACRGTVWRVRNRHFKQGKQA